MADPVPGVAPPASPSPETPLVSRITYYVEAPARTATTTTDYSAVKVTSSFLPSANKTYAVLWSAILDGSTTSFPTKVRLQKTTTTATTLAEEIQNPRNTTIATSNTVAGGLALYTAPASPVSQTIQIQVASGDATMTTGIQEARLFIIELIDGVDVWASSVAEQTTASSTYGAKVTLSWTPVTAGDYLTFASAELRPGTASIKARLFIDGATSASESLQLQYFDTSNTDWQPYIAAYRHQNIAASAHTARLDWGSNNAVAAPIRNAYAVSFRLSSFDSYFWAENRTEQSSTSSTYVDVAAVTGTPVVARYLMLTCAQIDGNTAGYQIATGTRLAVNSVPQGTIYAQQRGYASRYRHWIDIAVRTEAAASTAWSTQFARTTTGVNPGRIDENVLAILQIDAVTPPGSLLSIVGTGAASAGDHDDILAPPLPAGIAVGDLLMAVAYLRNAGTLSISAGWTSHYNLDTVQNGSSFYLQMWYRFATGSDSAPTITVTGGETGTQTLTLSFVVAARNVNTTTPFGTHGADSFNPVAANVGPITAPTGLPNNGAVLVLGIRNGTVWTSTLTLDGDGQTWVEDFDNYTNTVGALGISLALNHALWVGTAPTLTAKTFVPTGGAASPGMGKMFVLNAAGSGPAPVTQTTQLSADAVVATSASIAVSADVSVVSSATGIIVGAMAGADHVTAMTPALPSGVQVGDVLIAFGYLRGVGTLGISSGWVQHSLADLPQEIYMQTWFCIYDGSQVAPTISTTGGSTSPQTLSMSFVIAAHGNNTSSPFGTDGVDSVNVTQATIGPIAVPVSLPSSGTVIVIAFRNGTPWTSVPTLTGDALTWNENFDNYIHTVAGRSISGVANYATWSGSAPSLTAKTFSPVGGASAPALGKMFVLNATASVANLLTTNASPVVAAAPTISVSADASVVLGSFAIFVGADANVTLAGTGTVGTSADGAVLVSRTASVSADASVGSLTRNVTLSADSSVISAVSKISAISADVNVVLGNRTISQIVFCDAVLIPPPTQEGVLSAVGELSAERTDTAWLVLLTLSHADLPDSIRVTSDGVPTVNAGNVFSPFPFEIIIPDDVEGRPPQAQLSIDNTTQEVIAALRGLTSPPKLTVQIVRSVNTEIVEYQWVGLEWSASSYDKSVITGTLTFQDISREEFPYETYDGRWSGLFQG